jgi:antibiotic biosynthesis monooxygenase (ABM) superfamily enzyme
MHVSRASVVIVQRVPPAEVDWFLGWQADVAQAAEACGGYCGADVFPPSGDNPDEWVVLVHFEDQTALEAWLASPARAERVDRLRAKIGDFDLETLSGGFGSWFAGRAQGRASAPPGWKMALTVLLALFPTVMLLTIVVGPYTSPLGLAVSMLIGNALSISILQWAVMPVLTRLLGPWLHANANGSRKDVKGFAVTGLVVLVLASLATLFRQITG